MKKLSITLAAVAAAAALSGCGSYRHGATSGGNGVLKAQGIVARPLELESMFGKTYCSVGFVDENGKAFPNTDSSNCRRFEKEDRWVLMSELRSTGDG